MCGTVIMETKILEFAYYQKQEEREPGTIKNYLRSVRRFADWLGEREIGKEPATE